MTISIESITNQNITIVYKKLDLNSIDRNSIKGIIPETAPLVMDTPGLLFVGYMPKPWTIQFDERRVRINYPSNLEGVDNTPIWTYAWEANKLIPNNESELLAYGFNFDFSVESSEENLATIITNKYLVEKDRINNELGGEIQAFLPRLVFQKNSHQYDLIFEKPTENKMVIHINVHFQTPNIELPMEDELKHLFIQEYESLLELVKAILDK